jgi:hypothetical protein
MARQRLALPPGSPLRLLIVRSYCRFDCRLQCRNIVLNDIPNDLIVYSVISMPEPVSNIGNMTPGNSGILLLELLGQMAGCFAYDLQASFDPKPEKLVRDELLPGQVSGVQLKIANRFKDMLQRGRSASRASEDRNLVVRHAPAEFFRHRGAKHDLRFYSDGVLNEKGNTGKIDEGKAALGVNVDEHVQIAIRPLVTARPGAVDRQAQNALGADRALVLPNLGQDLLAGHGCILKPLFARVTVSRRHPRRREALRQRSRRRFCWKQRRRSFPRSCDPRGSLDPKLALRQARGGNSFGRMPQNVVRSTDPVQGPAIGA